jgi:tetratricopeptide (TPR) repeat protein
MNRIWKAGVLLASAVAIWPLNLGANGRSMPSSSPSTMREMTPEEMAREVYNSGVRHKDNGLKSEAKNPQKARSEYEKALKDFQRATELVPNLFQAYNGMGFAYRKTGDYEKALEMYSTALQMAPGFPDAIEYRGEAYLALNRIDDAKQAYMELFASDRKQADILMKAMGDWVTQRKAEPAGVDPAALTALEGWMKERAALAGQTVSMGLTPVHTAWQ